MRSHDWDRGMLLSMRTMSFPDAFPYEAIAAPVQIIIGADDTFLLKTATKVKSGLPYDFCNVGSTCCFVEHCVQACA